MTIPNRIKSDDGKEIGDGNFEYAEIYGNKLAKRASEAIESAKPVALSPIVASAQICYIPIDNNVYKFAFRRKAILRDAYVWADDPWASNPATFNPKDSTDKRAALKTEVAYIRLGDIHVAGIPGEAYPESIYGKFQEPVEPNADFPTAPLETPVVKALPGDKILVIGLANDEIGYIVPKRQWDFVPPYAYGMNKYQYGEVNSVGPEAAPVVYGSLVKAVEKADKNNRDSNVVESKVRTNHRLAILTWPASDESSWCRVAKDSSLRLLLRVDGNLATCLSIGNLGQP